MRSKLEARATSGANLALMLFISPSAMANENATTRAEQWVASTQNLRDGYAATFAALKTGHLGRLEASYAEEQACK